MSVHIPAILALCHLKRTTAPGFPNVSTHGTYRIGADIPKATWKTIELRMGTEGLRQYNQVHHLCTGGLNVGFYEAQETGLRNMTFHRRLCLAVMSTDLQKMGARGDKAAQIEKHCHRGRDHGLSYFYHHTKPEADPPM